MKLKHWRGVPAIVARGSPWMLGFVVLAAALQPHPLSARTRLHIAISAQIIGDETQFNEIDALPGEAFAFSLRARTPIQMQCRAILVSGATAPIACLYRHGSSAPWRKGFTAEPTLGKCRDTNFDIDPRQRVSVAVCISVGTDARPSHPS